MSGAYWPQRSVINAIAAFLLASAPASSTALFTQTKPSVEHEASSTTVPEEENLRIQLQFHPHEAADHKQLIDLLMKRYAFRAIVVEDAEWIRNNPRDFVALIQLTSYSKASLNDPEFSIAELRSFLGRTSRADNPEFYDNLTDQLAAELDKRRHTEQAIPLFAELVRLNPNEAGFWADYGDALSSLGQHAEAIQALHRAIELDPSTDVYHEILAEALINSEDLSGAETEYRASLSLYESQYKKGESADSLARELVKIQAASHEESALAVRHLMLAHVLLLERKYEEAIAHTRSALDADQYEFVALYLRAGIYDAKGDLENASKSREEAAVAIGRQADKEKSSGNEVPQMDPRVVFLNDALWNKKSGYPALPAEIVAILEPRVPGLSTGERYSLAMAYFGQSRVSDAKRQWEKAIETDPSADSAVGHANLGQELLEVGASKDALPHLRRAYELDPQNLTYRLDYELALGSPASNEGAPHAKFGVSYYVIGTATLLMLLGLAVMVLRSTPSWGVKPAGSEKLEPTARTRMGSATTEDQQRNPGGNASTVEEERRPLSTDEVSA